MRNKYNVWGLAIYDYLLCEIYRDKGYYLLWDANQCFEVADYFLIDEERVHELVGFCAEIGLFLWEKLTGEGILTSGSIQRRYKDMSLRARRKEPEFIQAYDLTSDEKGSIAEACQDSPEESDAFAEAGGGSGETDGPVTTNSPKGKKRKGKQKKEKHFLNERVQVNF